MASRKSSEEYGAEGGRKRAERLSKDEMAEIGRKGALARWGKEIPAAQCGSSDRPLRIGGLDIPCYVLDDGRRILTQEGVISALGMKPGRSTKGGGDHLSKFVATKALSPFVSKELARVITKPILFWVNGATTYGYEATVLADICDAVLDARKAKTPNYRQEHIAARCEILARSFARVGLVALVDEATGFQAERARDALAKILKALVQKELKKWVRTFPAAFYEQLCRLRGVPYPPNGKKIPHDFGHLANNIVYERLPPGVKMELKQRPPRDTKGRREQIRLQRLTDDAGNPRMQEHLASVVALMKISATWDDLEAHLNKALPVWDAMPPPALNG